MNTKKIKRLTFNIIDSTLDPRFPFAVYADEDPESVKARSFASIDQVITAIDRRAKRLVEVHGYAAVISTIKFYTGSSDDKEN